MLFHSIGFLFVFLPILLFALRVIPVGLPRAICILLFSYLFYSATEPRFVYLLLISSIVDYIVALRLVRASSTFKKKLWLTCSVVINLSVLGIFKYGAFALKTATPLAAYLGLPLPSDDFYKSFILPAGISFYTFQSLSYTIDVYRGVTLPTRSLIGFFNYVAYLPQLIAGPIERYSELAPQLKQFTEGKTTVHYSAAFDRIALGVFQKLFIADSASFIVDYLVNNSEPYTFFTGWALAIGFGIQIFYDFSAYTHMAIGIALLMGVHLTENFLSPYRAVSVQDFWHRWHITLSRWFRDYLYIPLGGSQGSVPRTYLNVMITFIVSGLWHGADWNFILWGTLHGSYLVLYRLFKTYFSKATIPTFFGILLTFVLVHFAWVVFRIHDIKHTSSIWRGMLGFNGFALNGVALADLFFLGIVTLVTQLVPNSAQRWPGSSGAFESILIWALALFAIFSSAEIQQFIYFQF